MEIFKLSLEDVLLSIFNRFEEVGFQSVRCSKALFRLCNVMDFLYWFCAKWHIASIKFWSIAKCKLGWKWITYYRFCALLLVLYCHTIVITLILTVSRNWISWINWSVVFLIPSKFQWISRCTNFGYNLCRRTIVCAG